MSDSVSRLNAALEGRYAIERELGEGGMATVYLADDLKHDRKVAVKVLRPELAAVLGAERFVQEIKTTAALQHPNILPLFDSGEVDGFLYYVMPFIDGETLREKLSRETQLGIDEAVRITTEVADALDYAHRHNVIHRDIKPENILLHDGRPIIADFGIALALSAAASGRMTETGLSLGTPHYMSPEQATADKDLTSRSDLYSLGAVLYEMLTGDPPHTGSSAQQVIMKIVTEDPVPVTTARRSVPSNVAAAVAMVLEKLPADRFESGAAFIAALSNSAFASAARAALSVDPRVHRLGFRAALPWGIVAVLAGVTVWSVSRPAPEIPLARYLESIPIAPAVSVPLASRIALSPDGSRSVYVGNDGRLWVRHRSTLDGTPLAGTEGAFNPFFSPDGKGVEFTLRDPQRLMLASFDGTPPLTGADSLVGISGAAWGRDCLYHAHSLGHGLVRTPVLAGAPEPVSTLDTARLEGDHQWPYPLPNGQGVLFTVTYRAGTRPSDIAVVDLLTGTHRVLVQGVRAQYAASGHLLFATANGTLMAAGFDQDRQSLTSESVPMIEELCIGPGVHYATDLAIASSGRLMYVPLGDGADRDLQTPGWVSRDGKFEPVEPTWTLSSFLTGGLALSPDGARLTIDVSGGGSGLSHVEIKRVGGGLSTQLTFDGEIDRRSTWAPDGDSVLFISNRGGLDQIWQVPAAGGGPSLITIPGEERQIFEVTMSPVGQWIVYRTDDDGSTAIGLGDIMAFRPGGDAEPIAIVATEYEETSPSVSPDGQWIAYVSTRTGRKEVYVSPFPNSEDRFFPVSQGGGTEPVWAHNGHELFYRDGDMVMVVAELDTDVDFEVRSLTELFDTPPYIEHPDHYWYAVEQGDQRFLMLRQGTLDGGADPGMIVTIDNFTEELTAKVGN